MYVKPFVSVALNPSGLVTTTFTTPATCAGAFAVIKLLLTTLTLVAAALSNLIVVPATNLLPLILTAVPPAVEPEFGETELIDGGCG